MGALIARRVRTSQPQQVAPIDRANPLAQNLVSLILPVAYPAVDLVTGQILTAVNTPTNTGGLGGTAVTFNGSSNYIYRSASELGGGAKFTLFAVVQSNGNAVDTRLVNIGLSTDTAPLIAIGAGTSNAQKVRLYSRNNSQASPVDVESVSTPFDGKLHTIVMTIDLSAATGRIALYVDGLLDTSASGSESFGSCTVDLISYGARLSTAASAFWKGSIFLAGVHNRILDPGEAAALSLNPWQLIRPQRRRLWLAYSAPVTTTYTPGSGAFVPQGYAPGVEQSAHQAVTPATAALSLTGYAPSLLQSVTTSIDPAPAALGLQGYGFVVEQSDHHSANPLPADLVFAGTVPGIEQTANQLLGPGFDGLALMGQAIGVVQAPMPADPRFARPIGDMASGNWTASDGGHLCDAVRQDDAVFMQTTMPGACEIKLAPVADPGTSTGQVVRYKAGSPSGSGLVVRLKQGSTIIASWAHPVLPVEDTLFTQTLTAAECDAITDYNDLRFEFEAY